MNVKHILEKLQSPSMRTVMAIAQHVGGGMAVTRRESIPFPTGTCQVWEFTAAMPPLDRPAVVVVVFLKQQKLVAWKPLAEDYEAAVRRFQDKSQGAPNAAAPSPKALVLPAPPPGMQVILPSRSDRPFLLKGASKATPSAAASA